MIKCFTFYENEFAIIRQLFGYRYLLVNFFLHILFLCVDDISPNGRRQTGNSTTYVICSLYLQVTSQPPSPAVTDHLVALFEDAVDYYTANEEDRRHLGETPELAATVLLANTVLNLDVAMSK